MFFNQKGSYLRKKFVRFNRNSLFFVLSVVDDAMKIRAVRKLARVVQTFLTLSLSFTIVILVCLAGLYLLHSIAVNLGEGPALLATLAVVVFGMALYIESSND